jgi:hypothetical protein
MSTRQIEAYLLARDAVRRIQRTASLIDAVSHRATASANGSQRDRHASH